MEILVVFTNGVFISEPVLIWGRTFPLIAWMTSCSSLFSDTGTVVSVFFSKDFATVYSPLTWFTIVKTNGFGNLIKGLSENETSTMGYSLSVWTVTGLQLPSTSETVLVREPSSGAVTATNLFLRCGLLYGIRHPHWYWLFLVCKLLRNRSLIILVTIL